MTGIVKRVITLRGFGFVIDQYGQERFVHATNLQVEKDWLRLKAGMPVEFEPIVRENGDKNRLGVSNLWIVERVV